MRLQKRPDGWKVTALGSDNCERDVAALAKRTASLENVLKRLNDGAFADVAAVVKAIKAADPKARPRGGGGQIGDSS
jgi:hypothetical protein